MSRKRGVTRSERTLLRAIRAAGAAGIRARQLRSMGVDSVGSRSIQVILHRMVEKGLITWVVKEKQPGAGRPAYVYVETERGKEVNL